MMIAANFGEFVLLSIFVENIFLMMFSLLQPFWHIFIFVHKNNVATLFSSGMFHSRRGFTTNYAAK